MRTDPVAKFMSLTGKAAAALLAVDTIGAKRMKLQAELREVEARLANPPPRWNVKAFREHVATCEARRDALLAEIAELRADENKALVAYQVAERYEATLRDALRARGLLA